MTDKRQDKVVPLTEGYQPKVPDTVNRGYRPQTSTPLDPKVLHLVAECMSPRVRR
jgi:hypothetical protein